MRYAISPSASDQTALIQKLLDTGYHVVLPAGFVTSVTGLLVPPAGAVISGANTSAILRVTANAPAINCNGAPSVELSDLTIMGTGQNYAGYGTGPSDLGQHGVHLFNCPLARVRNLRFSNLSGNAIDFEAPAISFAMAQTALFSDITVNHSFRGIYTHNFGEYASFSNIQLRNNVFGAEIASGNVRVSNLVAMFNSIGVKLNGSANQNPCHGTFSGGAINHNTYDLMAQSCGLGHVFSGIDFLGDQIGGITPAAQNIAIYNSRGISIVNGQVGGNIVVAAADPVTGSAALSGANLLSGNYIRDDLENFAAPVVGAGAKLLKRGNYNAAGLVNWND